MASSNLDSCFLERIRSKLLLGVLPRGLNLKVELAKRIQLWDTCEFNQLLIRAEE